MGIQLIKKVNENSTCWLKFQLIDEDGSTVNPISIDNIDTAKFTLYNQATGTVINSRNETNVKNYFDTAGNFLMLMTAADNAIVESETFEEITETHIAQFDIELYGPTVTALTEEIELQVTNLFTDITVPDGNGGGVTVGELKYAYLVSTANPEGDIHLSDYTNWYTSTALVKNIIVETLADDWDMWLLHNDNGYAVDDATVGRIQIMDGGNGDENIYLDMIYRDEDATREVHLYFIDNSSANTVDITVTGYYFA